MIAMLNNMFMTCDVSDTCMGIFMQETYGQLPRNPKIVKNLA